MAQELRVNRHIAVNEDGTGESSGHGAPNAIVDICHHDGGAFRGQPLRNSPANS